MSTATAERSKAPQQAAPSLLPTEKTPPSLSFGTAKVLLYGPPKIGKSTLCANLDPDHTLFLATEPGLGGVEVFERTIESWERFRQIGAELAKGGHPFKTIAVDTVDDLYKLCQDYVVRELLDGKHPSDEGYGKGWDALTSEFKLRVAKLASLGLGVWFISHAKTEEVKQRVGSISVTSPQIGGGGRKFLTGFCDYILFATSEQTADGEKRVLRTSATENYEAGGRVALPDPLPLDAAAVKKAMTDACASLTKESK